MLLSLIQLVAGVGVVLLLAAWASTNDMLAIISGLLGTFAWGMVAYGLFNIETVGNASAETEPALALLAVAMALATLTPALVNPFDAATGSESSPGQTERL